MDNMSVDSAASVWLSGWAFSPSALWPLRAKVEEMMGWSLPVGLRVGWSLGGIQIMQEVLRRPDEVSHLVLLSSTLRFCGDAGGWPGLPAAELRALQRRLAREPERALSAFHRMCATIEPAPVELTNRIQTSIGMGLPALNEGLRALTIADLRGSCPDIRLPTLVAHGARDRVIPVDAARRMAQCLPMASYCEHPAAGHDLPLSDPRWLADQIVAFLRRYP